MPTAARPFVQSPALRLSARVGRRQTMFKGLLGLFGRKTSSPNEQLQVLRESLDLRPDEIRIADLFLPFTPSAFFDKANWPGPFQLLALPDLGLTWAIERPSQTMLYLNHKTAAFWDRQGVDWQKQAMSNLAARSQPHPRHRGVLARQRSVLRLGLHAT